MAKFEGNSSFGGGGDRGVGELTWRDHLAELGLFDLFIAHGFFCLLVLLVGLLKEDK